MECWERPLSCSGGLVIMTDNVEREGGRAGRRVGGKYGQTEGKLHGMECMETS